MAELNAIGEKYYFWWEVGDWEWTGMREILSERRALECWKA